MLISSSDDPDNSFADAIPKPNACGGGMGRSAGFVGRSSKRVSGSMRQQAYLARIKQLFPSSLSLSFLTKNLPKGGDHMMRHGNTEIWDRQIGGGG